MSASIRATQARIEMDAQSLGASRIRENSLEVGDVTQGDSAAIAAGFRQMIQAVNAQDQVAAAKMAEVDAGRSDDLVGAMLASQQADLSFSMLIQARNKIVGAMEDLIKLQL